MRKRRMLLVLLSLALFFSCKSTEKSGGSVSAGKEDAKKIDEWKNPEMIGGKTKDIITQGYADVSKAGKGAARDRAVQDANQNAVKEVIGMYISSEKIVENNELISSKITANTTGYVASYKILEEGLDGDMYWVKVHAVVGMDRVEQNLAALGLLMDKMNLPRLVMLVEEKGIDANGNEWKTIAFGTKLEEYMGKKGFTFVDKAMLESVLEKEQIRFEQLGGASVSSDLISKIGVGTGAEIAIVGTAVARYFKNVGSTAMMSYVPSANVKVVNVSDATTIAQKADSTTGAVGGTDTDAADKALQKAVVRQGSDGEEGVGPELVSMIANKWQKITQDGTEYTLLITGLDFGGFTEFKNKLPEYLRDAKKIFTKGYLEDASKILLRWNGTASSLAEQLYLRADEMGFKVDIKNVEDKVITLIVAKKAE